MDDKDLKAQLQAIPAKVQTALVAACAERVHKVWEDHWVADYSTAPLQGQQFMTFYTNTPQEEIEISADAVFPVAAAEEAAIEFFRFPEAPRRIKWLET
jgi:hypothetical protein